MLSPSDFVDKTLNFNALEGIKQLPDGVVDMCMTSPPYWGLRNYGTQPQIWDAQPDCDHEWIDEVTQRPNQSGGKSDNQSEGSYAVDYVKRVSVTHFCSKCGAWLGELGSEPTPSLYISHLCDIFDEIKRVLKPDGSIWVNIGDTYNAGRSGGWAGGKNGVSRPEIAQQQSGVNVKELPAKSLIQIPSRFAIEMSNRGWVLRNELIWYKRNCMPSSATDRFTVDFEKIFLFTQRPDYYFETQYEPMSMNRWGGRYKNSEAVAKAKPGSGVGYGSVNREGHDCYPNPLGRIKRAVWDIPPTACDWDYCLNCNTFFDSKNRQKIKIKRVGVASDIQFQDYDAMNEDELKDVIRQCPNCNGTDGWVDHFAVFPEDLLETPIKAGCPEHICVKCGKAKTKEQVPIGLKETADAGVTKLNDKPYAIKERTGFVGIRDLPPMDVVKDYLNYWRKESRATIEYIEIKMESQAPHHWFNGESYPTKEDWLEIKDILHFDDKYDQQMTTEKFKPAEKCSVQYEEKYVGCQCDAKTVSGIVLDPFMGSGTTAVMAWKLRRHFIGFDVNPKYVALATKRLEPLVMQKRLF